MFVKLALLLKLMQKLNQTFVNPAEFHSIKATQSLERLYIIFEGPLPSTSKNRCMLTVADEYLRYCFDSFWSNVES